MKTIQEFMEGIVENKYFNGKKTYLAVFGYLLLVLQGYLETGIFDVQTFLMALTVAGIGHKMEKLL